MKLRVFFRKNEKERWSLRIPIWMTRTTCLSRSTLTNDTIGWSGPLHPRFPKAGVEGGRFFQFCHSLTLEYSAEESSKSSYVDGDPSHYFHFPWLSQSKLEGVVVGQRYRSRHAWRCQRSIRNSWVELENCQREMIEHWRAFKNIFVTQKSHIFQQIWSCAAYLRWFDSNFLFLLILKKNFNDLQNSIHLLFGVLKCFL